MAAKLGAIGTFAWVSDSPSVEGAEDTGSDSVSDTTPSDGEYHPFAPYFVDTSVVVPWYDMEDGGFPDED
jgi:hypothetical protein